MFECENKSKLLKPVIISVAGVVAAVIITKVVKAVKRRFAKVEEAVEVEPNNADE